MEGVLDTRSGWIGAHEVVTVRFDPRTLPYGELLEAAVASDCALRAWWTTPDQEELARAKLGDSAAALEDVPRDAKASDQLYYLERSPYAALPLTPLQARRVNGALHLGEDPTAWLSPRQRGLAARIADAPEETRARVAALERPADIAGLADHQRRLLDALEKR